jgi:hypothetical protein
VNLLTASTQSAPLVSSVLSRKHLYASCHKPPQFSCPRRLPRAEGSYHEFVATGSFRDGFHAGAVQRVIVVRDIVRLVSILIQWHRLLIAVGEGLRIRGSIAATDRHSSRACATCWIVKVDITASEADATLAGRITGCVLKAGAAWAPKARVAL